MTQPSLDQVHRAAEDITQALLGNGPPDALFRVTGPATAGKSTALREIGARLDQDGEYAPVLISPPARQLDSGPAALVDCVSTLGDAAILDGQAFEWADSRAPWPERLNQVRSWLDEHGERIVLLCDEPGTWRAEEPGEAAVFSMRAQQAAHVFVAHAKCRRVVAGALGEPITETETWTLEPATAPSGWLDDPQAWGMLADDAERLGRTVDGLERRTPLDVRILVAIAHLDSTEEASRRLDHEATSSALARYLADVISGRPQLGDLWAAWQTVAHMRRAFDPELLDGLGVKDAAQRDVLRHCLLYGEEELRLHPVLRTACLRRRDRDAPEQRLKMLFDYHLARSRHEDPGALPDRLEAFHFLSEAGDTGLREQVAPMFAEQLDALGYLLSHRQRRFKEAAEVFREAIEWDPEDDYAHHYLAYNLARSHGPAVEVEDHYRKALELNPKHVWWYSRLIDFFVRRGRLAEARARWDEALVALSVEGYEGTQRLYETLHLRVARALLRHAELAFAREVLEDVPGWIAEGIPEHAELVRLLEGLLEAERTGAFMPARRLRREWWKQEPERLQARLGTGQQLRRWLAGRVAGVDEEGLHLRVAELSHPPDDEPPAISWTTIDRDRFERLCRDDVSLNDLAEGRFVEIGLYAAKGKRETETVLRVLQEDDWQLAAHAVRKLQATADA